MQPSSHAKITAPLLSRLVDQSPEHTQDLAASNYVSLQHLYEMIRQDLEHLLNALKKWLHLPSHLHQLEHSLVNYGVHDFAHNYFGSTSAQNRLCRDIKALIQRFEPRLKRVQVSMQQSDVAIERILKLRIEAMIDITPNPAPAVFESAMDISKYTFNFI
jgi:type VI secretion system protein ImpF